MSLRDTYKRWCKRLDANRARRFGKVKYIRHIKHGIRELEQLRADSDDPKFRLLLTNDIGYFRSMLSLYQWS